MEADPVVGRGIRGARGFRKNLTRRSPSIAARLVDEGDLHLLPVYFLLSLSDLAREGIDHSGSYRFADHLYRAQASGRLVIGRWVDRCLLGLPAARAFRRRYLRAQEAMRAGLAAFPQADPLRILTVPCGLPRDVAELARRLSREDPRLHQRIAYCGMDIDPEALRLAERLTRDTGIRAEYHEGDALRREQYPASTFHVVASTGLGEFLDDSELERFYRNVYDVLAPGGTFYTSATARDPRSEALLRIVELVTHYRARAQLEALLRRLPWRQVTMEVDPTGLQTFAIVVK